LPRAKPQPGCAGPGVGPGAAFRPGGGSGTCLRLCTLRVRRLL